MCLRPKEQNQMNSAFPGDLLEGDILQHLSGYRSLVQQSIDTCSTGKMI